MFDTTFFEVLFDGRRKAGTCENVVYIIVNDMVTNDDHPVFRSTLLKQYLKLVTSCEKGRCLRQNDCNKNPDTCDSVK